MGVQLLKILSEAKTCRTYLVVCTKCKREFERTGHMKVIEAAKQCRQCYLDQARDKRMRLVCVIAEATEQIGRPPTYAELAARCVCSRTHLLNEVKKLKAEGFILTELTLKDPYTGLGQPPHGVKLTDAGRLVAARASRVSEAV